MALLTAEDVLNKAFSKTKYREGFDQDEVDDFLDEVANTIAQLTAERDELAARVASGGGVAAPALAPEAPPATAAGGVPGTTGLLAAATEPGAANPTGMLAMAQKLHDEYVQAGEAERDRIIDEAHSAADQIRERADDDAKARMEELSGERADLQARIDDLRRFERDYRARLKAYLENLLGDLDHSGTPGAAAAGLAGGFAGFGAGEGVADAAPADAAADATPDAAGEPDGYVVEDVVVAEVFESEDGQDEVVVVDEYETVTPVSFDEALSGYQPADAAAESAAEPATEFTPEAPAQEQAFQPPAAPSYDASQSWESQLRPQGEEAAPANPWAPVNAPQGDVPSADEVPGVDQPQGEEAPYTPPSSRMFNDLYTQQRPESENQ